MGTLNSLNLMYPLPFSEFAKGIMRMYFGLVFAIALAFTMSIIISAIYGRYKSMLIYCIGAPFSGKSKSRIAKRFGMKVFSTGDLFRSIASISEKNVLDKNELCLALTSALAIIRIAVIEVSGIEEKEIQEIASRQSLDPNAHRLTISLSIIVRNKIATGEILPSRWIQALVNLYFEQSHQGLLFDGAPRTLEQAQSLKTPHRVLHFELSADELLSRAIQRAAQEPNRTDNDSRIWQDRIRSWTEVEDQILAYYAQKQIPIRKVRSSGPYWWGVAKTTWALLTI